MEPNGTRSFVDMPVQSVMTKEVKTAQVSTSLIECVEVMKRSNVGSVIVLEKSKPVGIFTERDLVRNLADRYASLDIEVNKVMSKPLTVISPNTTVWEAITLMGRFHIRHLPVAENDSVKGIITETDVLRLVIAQQYLIIESVSESLPATTKEKLKVISGHFGVERPTPRIEE